MQIRLETVREEPFSWEEQVTIPGDRLELSDPVELGPVSLQGRIEWADPDFRLRARYSYRQQLVCTRCLQPMEEEVDGEVELLVSVKGTAPTPGEMRLEDADLGLLELESEELDTEPLVFEQLQLNVPMKPLCRPDCRGLCGGCGADLNTEECRCESAPVDPRWEALAALKGRMDEEL